MKINLNKHKFLTFILILTILLVPYVTYENNALTTTKVIIENNKIPESFNGYKIIHISDLHNKSFGDNQHKLLDNIEEASPNIIVITGDLIDSRNTNIDIALDFINGAVKIAPTFYVSGNHEARTNLYANLKSRLQDSGVVVLDNERIELIKDNEVIELIGLLDNSFIGTDYYNSNPDIKKVSLAELTEGSHNFKILLSHRPELLSLYADNNVDLVFSGHAHGGQINLPIIGPIIAPGQGFFPKLVEGIHTEKNTTMVISRGLGTSVIPVRILNNPEIIEVTLKN